MLSLLCLFGEVTYGAMPEIPVSVFENGVPAKSGMPRLPETSIGQTARCDQNFPVLVDDIFQWRKRFWRGESTVIGRTGGERSLSTFKRLYAQTLTSDLAIQLGPKGRCRETEGFGMIGLRSGHYSPSAAGSDVQRWRSADIIVRDGDFGTISRIDGSSKFSIRNSEPCSISFDSRSFSFLQPEPYEYQAPYRDGCGTGGDSIEVFSNPKLPLPIIAFGNFVLFIAGLRLSDYEFKRQPHNSVHRGQSSLRSYSTTLLPALPLKDRNGILNV
jgi:hypothetical protein